MSYSNRPPTKNKNPVNKTIPWLIILKTLIDQTGVNSLSDFFNYESDWQTVPLNSTKYSRSSNTSPITKKKKTRHKCFFSANRFFRLPLLMKLNQWKKQILT